MYSEMYPKPYLRWLQLAHPWSLAPQTWMAGSLPRLKRGGGSQVSKFLCTGEERPLTLDPPLNIAALTRARSLHTSSALPFPTRGIFGMTRSQFSHLGGGNISQENEVLGN